MKVSGSNGSDFQVLEPGTYVARCIRIVDIGTQYGEYQGKPYARRQVVVEWELPTELVQGGEWDGQPMTVRKFYTASLHKEASLRKDLMNWRGRDFTPDELEGFELGNILGVPCLLTLTANENGRVKITGVTRPPKGTGVPAQVNSPTMFDLDAFDQGLYDGLSEWLKETIAKTPEYRQATSGGAAVPGGASPADDSIPF